MFLRILNDLIIKSAIKPTNKPTIKSFIKPGMASIKW